MKIQVSWGDILLGRRRYSDSCAVARAFKRQLPYIANVCVGPAMVGFNLRGEWLPRYLPLPTKAQTFIARFDSVPVLGRLWVRPFSFEVPASALAPAFSAEVIAAASRPAETQFDAGQGPRFLTPEYSEILF